MLSVLQQILCWIKQIGAMVLNAIIDGINYLILALAAFVQGIIDLIPINVPDPPTMPSEFNTALKWVAWVFPVGTVVTLFAFVVTAWIAWQVVAIALRWLRALSD